MTSHNCDMERLRARISELEKKIRDMDRSCDALFRFSENVLCAQDLTTLYQVIVQASMDLLDLDCSTLLLLDASGDSLTVKYTKGFLHSMTGIFGLGRGQGLAWLVINDRKAVVVEDFSVEKRLSVPGIIQDEGIISAMGVPMILGGEPTGVLIGYSRTKRHFSSRQVIFYQSIANQATVAIKNLKGFNELKHEKMLLRQRESQLQCIMHSVPVVIAMLKNQRFHWVSNSVAELTGYMEHELVGRNVKMLYQDVNQYIRTRNRLYNAMKHSDKASMDTQFRRKDGVLVGVHISISPVDGECLSRGIIATALDISDLKDTEKKLAGRTAQFQAIFNAIHDAVIFTDTGRKIRMVNPAFHRIFRYSKTEVMGHAPVFLYNNEKDYRMQRLRPDSGLSSYMYRGKVQYRKKDGTLFPGDAMVVKVLDKEKKIIGYLTIIRDLTSIEKAREEKEFFEQQMRHVQKLESLGVMAGGIAHDFNNFLMSILGNAELAQFEIASANPAHNYLSAVISAARKAAELCQQMLAYAGKANFKLVYADINAMITEMAQILKTSLGKRVTMHLQLSEDLHKVHIDPVQVRQVIMNLMLNASEAIADDIGRVRISTSMIHLHSEQLKQVWFQEELSAGSYVLLEVKDTGCGMDKEVLARLFDPFFTTKSTGRGLGMAAVMGIIHSHSGGITVTSRAGEGTTVKILLPAFSAGECSSMCTAFPPSHKWEGHGLVLIVDHEEEIRHVTGNMLEHIGFDVVNAGDGESAINIFRQHSEDIQCVMLTPNLPGKIKGKDLLARIYSIDPEIKVIIASGYNEQEMNKQFGEYGSSGFIQKPYTMDELRQVIQRVMDQ